MYSRDEVVCCFSNLQFDFCEANIIPATSHWQLSLFVRVITLCKLHACTKRSSLLKTIYGCCYGERYIPKDIYIALCDHWATWWGVHRGDLPPCMYILHWRIKYCTNKSITDGRLEFSSSRAFSAIYFSGIWIENSIRTYSLAHTLWLAVASKNKRMCFFFGCGQFHCWSSNTYNTASSPSSLTVTHYSVEMRIYADQTHTNNVLLNIQEFLMTNSARTACTEGATAPVTDDL